LRFTDLVGMDFGVIAADFDSIDEALRRCAAIADTPDGDPPAGVVGLIDELDRIDAIREDGGFLSWWPLTPTPLGVGVSTRWQDHVVYTLLEMTKDRGLALVDLQPPQWQVFDPRGRVEVEVTLGNGTRLPYLTEQIVIDVMANQTWYGNYIVAEREQDTYVQSLYKFGEVIQVEYRAGHPDRHFQTLTDDRSLVPQLISAWLRDGPDAPQFAIQRWQRLEL
jgi:hypothetical protein